MHGVFHHRGKSSRRLEASRCSTQTAKPSPTYARERDQADIAGVLTFDEARRIAVNVAKLSELLRAR
jgi:hypothetical protein